METKDVILQLRAQKGLSQEELAQKFVCYKTGGFQMGKWRDGSKCGHIEIDVEIF